MKLRSRVEDILVRAECDGANVTKQISGLDDNLDMIERLYARLKAQHPNAVTNIWLERLLTSILKNDYDGSEAIIRDRLDNHDSGGFQVGSKSFYDLANEYLRAIR